ncbi:S1 family peptidase [Aquabacter sp. P-9]|uniref:S1 family peptidase n=1 Tax=Aquabacter sediminis TaxID=3029197 RepID=UPI00237E32AB|nr:serine protease [Aquabacter sp. P-9]MDE1567853.1 serine protease [Aquabacter sp. P-9]
MDTVRGGTLLGDVYNKVLQEPVSPDDVIVGSGFFIQPSVVLTSAHVLAGCQSFMVENRYLGLLEARRGNVIGDRDAAFLNVKGVSADFLSASEVPAKGDLTILGFPADQGGDRLPRRYQVRGFGRKDDVLMLWGVNVPAGLSGGAIVDQRGQAIALLTGRINNGAHDLIASPIGAFRHEIEEKVLGSIFSSSTAERAIVKVRCK